ncbi:uncharacterized protein LOC113356446 [Papaver somniferum]|uniref:uncharacterized protein LOC113356446 n=1 Tax=Papaver somniferum TaxID=3469 RepID=UPI000E6FB226|nr:uncharacterized protein LOC113356446 [Papaver somniferum]
MSKLSETRLQHNTMLRQKSRNQWIAEGSSNSSFFHNSIRIRRSSNTISELVDSTGQTISDYDLLRDHVVQFCADKFNGIESTIDDSLFNYDHVSISEEESLAMDRIPTSEEIKQAVVDLRADSAPGPDGFLILATRLGSVLDNLVSEEQVVFMKGRNIHENISLASEMVNELHIKTKDGNIGLKLDISQAFDTVSWSFILEVFRRYGFSDKWCDWILNILNSARISILLNGSPEGYFKIVRGLRQGDPLSPLIFLLIEDVLSRNISKLFLEKKMSHMVTRGGISPTHLFFDDDIMMFCKGNLKSLQNLVDLLGRYQVASGQTVCRQKSKIYYGGGSLSRRNYLADYLGMSVATFTDRYLGVQIMPRTVRYHHISGVVEKIKDQLAGWKGFLLSFHDRLVLVKSVIASYSIHNMVIYKWPSKFILQCERAIRNFIWTGDSNVSRVVVVAYDKVCFPFEEGVLGLTRLETMNTALLMKLWWKIRTSKKKWAGFLRAKCFNRNGCIKLKGLKSSILPGIRNVYKTVESNTKVLIGDGRDTSLYYDAWFLERCFANILNDYTLDRTVLVSAILIDGHWDIPVEHLSRMTAGGFDSTHFPTTLNGADTRIWKPYLHGNFTVSSAKEIIRQKYPKFDGTTLLWRKEVHPTLAAHNWKFLRGACATYDVIQKRFKINLANRCCLCGVEDESLEHVLFYCSFAGRAWNWIADIFNLVPNANLVLSCKATNGRSGMIRDLWLIDNLVIRSEIWAMRNKAVFQRQQPNWGIFFKRVLKLIQDFAARLKGFMHNCAEDVIILYYFRVNYRRVKLHQPLECFWEPPEIKEIQI